MSGAPNHSPEQMRASDRAQASKGAAEPLQCALSGRELSADEAYWAPPLITVQQLVTTTVKTAIRTPGLLGKVLFDELPNVPYAPEVQEELASRRTSEQFKLILLLLFLLALIILPIVLLLW